MANNAFYPRYSQISDITNDVQATITFTEEHDFTPGEVVSFRVGPQFGMNEINNKKARVLITTDDSITVGLNSQYWTPFTLANLNQPGTSPTICVPSASSVVPFQENPSVNLEDSFDNRRV